RHALPHPSGDVPAQMPATLRLRLRGLPLFLQSLATVLLIAALARPQAAQLMENPEREGIAIELLVDVSSSMDMRMGGKTRSESRLTVAQQVIKEFVEGNEQDLLGRPDDLIGLITFARYADTVCPLTHSHEALVFFSENLTINDRPNEDGTAYGDAAALAAARLSRLENRLARGGPIRQQVQSKIIVLLTDGENNCGKMLPLQAAALAKKWDIRIYTISITEAPKSQFVRVDGQESIEAARVRSSAERILEEMAKATGGIFRKAHNFASLSDVYQEIDQLERSRMTTTLREVAEERFHWFALGALLCLVLQVLVESTWLRRIP
ncbi:MAG: VWA domain-containing protein, partial [Verrucomicrobiota bacterium]